MKSDVKRMRMNEIRVHKHIEKCVCYKTNECHYFQTIGPEVTENVLINYQNLVLYLARFCCGELNS